MGEDNRSSESYDDVYVDKKAFEAVRSEKKHIGRIGLFILLTLVITVIAGYFSMVYICGRLLNPGTEINGQDFSFKTLDYVENELEKPYKDYSIRIIFRDGDRTVKASDIDFSVSFMDQLEAVNAGQNPYEWYKFNEKKQYTCEPVISYDRKKLEKLLGEDPRLIVENMIAPENPEIKMVDGQYMAVEGDPGTTIDTDIFYQLLSEHILKMDKEFKIEEEGCYKTAWYTPDSQMVTRCVEKANRYLNSEIYYMYGDTEVKVVDAKVMEKLIRIDKAYKVTISRDDVKQFFNDFADMHDTFKRDRNFKTHDGKIVPVQCYTYGWELDRDNELGLLYSDILSGGCVYREPVFTQKGFAYKASENSVDDIGDTYAEVDLTNQKVYLYADGKLVLMSDCVSGKVTAGMSTPAGVYKINYMQYKATLTGGGTPVDVDYWMPFNGGIGFHDATWRYKFGGDIYYANGSHGCVNLPYDSARTFFQNAKTGMPVVCYWR